MELLASIAVFLVFALLFMLGSLILSRVVQPRLSGAEKRATYECGEPTIGSSWVQFDLRFYIVALFYLVFDVEVALLYPWATVFRQFPAEALVLGLPFVLIVVVGFAYEWNTGSLDWVRSAVTTSMNASPGVPGRPVSPPTPGMTVTGVSSISGGLSGSSGDPAKVARVDPEVLEERRERAQ